MANGRFYYENSVKQSRVQYIIEFVSSTAPQFLQQNNKNLSFFFSKFYIHSLTHKVGLIQKHLFTTYVQDL